MVMCACWLSLGWIISDERSSFSLSLFACCCSFCVLAGVSLSLLVVWLNILSLSVVVSVCTVVGGIIGGMLGGLIPVGSGGFCRRLLLAFALVLPVRHSLMIVSTSLCGVAPPLGRFLMRLRGIRSAVRALARGTASVSDELVVVPLYVVVNLFLLPLLYGGCGGGGINCLSISALSIVVGLSSGVFVFLCPHFVHLLSVSLLACPHLIMLISSLYSHIHIGVVARC